MLLKNINYIDENFEYIENVNILIDKDSIKYIGKELLENYHGEIYDGKNKLAVPGFYNAHCHVPMTVLRGYGDGLPLDEWLFGKVIPFEGKLTPEDMYWGTLHGCMEMIKSGVVSFSDMYFNLQRMIDAVDEIGLKLNICNGISSFDPNADLFDVNGVKETMDLVEKYNSKNGKVQIDMGIHSEYLTYPSLVKSLSDYAKEKNLIVHVHISETEKEHEECKTRHGMSPIQYFEKIGLLENKVNAAHCVWVDDKDIEIMRNYDFTVAHCPSSNMKLGSGFAPIKKLLDKEINVTIGTDGASSNNNLNMLEEMNLASMIGKGINHDPQFLKAKDIFKLATLNGAKMQGRENCGAIKVGNKGDIVIFDMNHITMRPLIDPLSNVLYSASTEAISINMVDGEVIYKDGKFTKIDEEKVLKEIDKIVERISSQLEE